MTTIDPTAAGIDRFDGSRVKALSLLLGCETLSPETSAQLQAAIRTCLRERSLPEQAPEGDAEAIGLGRLGRQAAELRESFSGLSEKGLEQLAAAASSGREGLRKSLEEMQTRLDLIAAAAEKAVADLRGARRQHAAASGKEALQRLILSLVPIFEGETGKEAGNSWHPIQNVYFGPFFDFVTAVFDIAAPGAALGNAALGQLITRSLMKTRELSGNYLARSHGRFPRVQPLPKGK